MRYVGAVLGAHEAGSHLRQAPSSRWISHDEGWLLSTSGSWSRWHHRNGSSSKARGRYDDAFSVRARGHLWCPEGPSPATSSLRPA